MALYPLAGLVLAAADPDQVATFYREVLELPLQRARHGRIREHWEGEINQIHFAVLPKGQQHAGSTLTPSFAVPNLARYLEHLSDRGIQPLHPVIDLGDGKRVTTICDVEGNTIRLIQVDAT